MPSWLCTETKIARKNCNLLMLSLMLSMARLGWDTGTGEWCMWTHKPSNSHHSIDQTTKPIQSGMLLRRLGNLEEQHQGGRQGMSAHLGHILTGDWCETPYLAAWQKDEQGALGQNKHASCITAMPAPDSKCQYKAVNRKDKSHPG